MPRSPISRLRRLRPQGSLPVAILALGLAFVAVPASVSADEGHEHGQASNKASQDAPDCPPGLAKELRAAGDRFAEACDLPGGDLAAMNDSGAVLPEGSTASSKNLGLIANIPKQGAFASETAYNSDLAFKGNFAFAGNYEGFMVYDISKPGEPKVVTQVVCTGAQNDVSVWKNLLILSVDSSRNDDSCQSESQDSTIKSAWEGIRVFDISRPARPRYIAAVETDCGSHTHTLAPSKNSKDLFVYVSSYFPDKSFPDCKPPHDKISVVKIPGKAPKNAFLSGTPRLFPGGGNPEGNNSSETTGCHDITAYPQRDIAAGACMGDGILMDISNRARPVVTERVRDRKNFAFWHSATFDNAGRKVVFTDELGGGGGPTCNPDVGPNKGADGIYNIVRGNLDFKSYYKISRTQSNTENCVAHNGSLIPVKGKDIMVQAWYQGGISVFDFTNSANPREIAWFDRGPLDDEQLRLGGSWSAYWYNGFIYSNDIQKGLDVLNLRDQRIGDAKRVRTDVFNAQSQPSYNG